jgi:hypothetical protein
VKSCGEGALHFLDTDLHIYIYIKRVKLVYLKIFLFAVRMNLAQAKQMLYS